MRGRKRWHAPLCKRHTDEEERAASALDQATSAGRVTHLAVLQMHPVESEAATTGDVHDSVGRVADERRAGPCAFERDVKTIDQERRRH